MRDLRGLGALYDHARLVLGIGSMGSAIPTAPYEVLSVDHSGSAPPSPPPPPPERHGTGRHASMPEGVADRALRIALEARGAIGRAPDPSSSPPDPGLGMRRTLAEIKADVGEVKAIVLSDVASRARISSRAWWAVWIVVAVLLGVMTTAAVSIATRIRIVDAEQADGRALSKR